MRVERDTTKHARTFRNRGTVFDDGARTSAGRIVIRQGGQRVSGEERFAAVGECEGDRLTFINGNARKRNLLDPRQIRRDRCGRRSRR